MRTLRRNKSNLYYSLYKESEVVYLTDEDGNIVYEEVDGEEVPVEIGHNPPAYNEPVEFKGYIQFKGGEDEARAFGVSVGSYTHLLIMRKDEIPITETSLIFDHEPQGEITENTADYKVYRVAPSLNFVTYLLKSVDK